jgi:hypothetical protein
MPNYLVPRHLLKETALRPWVYIKVAEDWNLSLFDRLKLLQNARQKFPRHPTIKYVVDEIQKLLVQKVERDASQAIREVNFSASLETFDAALTILKTAKDSVEKALIGSEFGTALAVIEDQIGSAEIQVRKQQFHYERMITTIKYCKIALTNYKTSKDKSDLRVAADYLESITTEFKEHPLVKETRRDLSRH